MRCPLLRSQVAQTSVCALFRPTTPAKTHPRQPITRPFQPAPFLPLSKNTTPFFSTTSPRFAIRKIAQPFPFVTPPHSLPNTPGGTLGLSQKQFVYVTTKESHSCKNLPRNPFRITLFQKRVGVAPIALTNNSQFVESFIAPLLGPSAACTIRPGVCEAWVFDVLSGTSALIDSVPPNAPSPAQSLLPARHSPFKVEWEGNPANLAFPSGLAARASFGSSRRIF